MCLKRWINTSEKCWRTNVWFVLVWWENNSCQSSWIQRMAKQKETFWNITSSKKAHFIFPIKNWWTFGIQSKDKGISWTGKCFHLSWKCARVPELYKYASEIWIKERKSWMEITQTRSFCRVLKCDKSWSEHRITCKVPQSDALGFSWCTGWSSLVLTLIYSLKSQNS